MLLVMLMVPPVLIGAAGIVFSKGKISLLEFFLMEGVILLVLGMGMGLSYWGATDDVEIWSGRVVNKEKDTVSCSHSYSCNPHPCGKDNKDTCYEHAHDYDWIIHTSNQERIEINRVDRQGSIEPPRFAATRYGEPTAVPHHFTNYIKATPGSILRRTTAAEKFPGQIPKYPNEVYDYCRLKRFIQVGINVPDADEWNRIITEDNADLGKQKQVNIVVIVTNIADPMYEYAVEEAWIGGKKNDVIVLISSPQYPKIEWVRIISWTKSEELKVELRDEIQRIGNLDQTKNILWAVRTYIDQKFVRRPMADFEYLASNIQPGPT